MKYLKLRSRLHQHRLFIELAAVILTGLLCATALIVIAMYGRQIDNLLTP